MKMWLPVLVSYVYSAWIMYVCTYVRMYSVVLWRVVTSFDTQPTTNFVLPPRRPTSSIALRTHSLHLVFGLSFPSSSRYTIKQKWGNISSSIYFGDVHTKLTLLSKCQEFYCLYPFPLVFPLVDVLADLRQKSVFKASNVPSVCQSHTHMW
jgi:hypothetical protein